MSLQTMDVHALLPYLLEGDSELDNAIETLTATDESRDGTAKRAVPPASSLNKDEVQSKRENDVMHASFVPDSELCHCPAFVETVPSDDVDCTDDTGRQCGGGDDDDDDDDDETYTYYNTSEEAFCHAELSEKLKAGHVDGASFLFDSLPTTCPFSQLANNGTARAAIIEQTTGGAVEVDDMDDYYKGYPHQENESRSTAESQNSGYEATGGQSKRKARSESIGKKHLRQGTNPRRPSRYTNNALIKREEVCIKNRNYPCVSTEPEVCEYFNEPTNEDVIAGRGGRTNKHVGNVEFLNHVRYLQPEYAQLPKDEKWRLTDQLIDSVHAWGGRFLAEGEDGRWYEIDYKESYTKASQALRETPEKVRAKRARWKVIKKQTRAKGA